MIIIIIVGLSGHGDGEPMATCRAAHSRLRRRNADGLPSKCAGDDWHLQWRRRLRWRGLRLRRRFRPLRIRLERAEVHPPSAKTVPHATCAALGRLCGGNRIVPQFRGVAAFPYRNVPDSVPAAVGPFSLGDSPPLLFARKAVRRRLVEGPIEHGPLKNAR